jgi:DNA-binding XRE family transcriptional regulator
MSEQDYLSEAIRAARRRAGLSQAELAAALGVRQSSVSQWERGSTRPSTDHLLALTSILRTTLLDFSAAAKGQGDQDGSGGQGLAAGGQEGRDGSGPQGLAAGGGGADRDGSGGQDLAVAGGGGDRDGSGGGLASGERAASPSAVAPGAEGGERVR